jgi:hypothetical protein
MTLSTKTSQNMLAKIVTSHRPGPNSWQYLMSATFFAKRSPEKSMALA